MTAPTAEQVSAFKKLDHDTAEVLLRLGERHDADKLIDLEEIGAWESPEQYLEWFLQMIQAGTFDRRQSIYIRSALSRKHPVESPGVAGEPSTDVTPNNNNATNRKKVRK